MNDENVNKSMSKFDVDQCVRYKFDDEKRADRVFVINPMELKFDDKIVVKEFEKIEVPTVIKEPQIINVPTIVKEIEKIEIPVITKEVQIQTIEVPKIIIQEKIQKIEIPVINSEKEFEKFPNIVKICMIVQSLALIGLMVVNIIKK